MFESALLALFQKHHLYWSSYEFGTVQISGSGHFISSVDYDHKCTFKWCCLNVAFLLLTVKTSVCFGVDMNVAQRLWLTMALHFDIVPVYLLLGQGRVPCYVYILHAWYYCKLYLHSDCDMSLQLGISGWAGLSEHTFMSRRLVFKRFLNCLEILQMVLILLGD